MVQQADAELEGGAFLLERLGGERHLDPLLMATLLALRRQLIEDHRATTATERLLVDHAVLAHYRAIRISGWIGDLGAQLEAEFFRAEGPSVKLREGFGAGAENIRGLKAEELVRRLAEQLYPLLDRANRMLIRDLKALRALREPSGPSVSIGKVGQMNVAAAQANAVVRGAAGA